MWSQTYLPLGGLGSSALLAVLPVALMLFLLGVARKPAWLAGSVGCAAALALALFGYHMPLNLAFSAMLYGIANGLLPIGWIVFTAILMYRLAVETGKFEIIKDSIGNLTSDRFMQALLIAFAFGAFIEGASGFGTPVAVAAAMLVGLGMPAFYAACHLPAGKYGARGVRGDRHSSGDAANRYRYSFASAFRGCGPRVRSAIAVRAGVPGGRDGRQESAAESGAGGDGVRRCLRLDAVHGFELRGSAPH